MSNDKLELLDANIVILPEEPLTQIANAEATSSFIDLFLSSQYRRDAAVTHLSKKYGRLATRKPLLTTSGGGANDASAGGASPNDGDASADGGGASPSDARVLGVPSEPPQA